VGGSSASGGGATGTVTVAVVANPQMQQMEQLVHVFESENKGITVKFDTLPENEERAQTQKDVATGRGLSDVVMISNYETPIWAKNGWLDNLSGNSREGASLGPGARALLARSMPWLAAVAMIPVSTVWVAAPAHVRAATDPVNKYSQAPVLGR